MLDFIHSKVDVLNLTYLLVHCFMIQWLDATNTMLSNRQFELVLPSWREIQSCWPYVAEVSSVAWLRLEAEGFGWRGPAGPSHLLNHHRPCRGREGRGRRRRHRRQSGSDGGCSH